MGSSNLPSVATLDRPEKYQDLLKEDRADDCTPCRVIGGGAFLGLGAYTYFSGQSQLLQQQQAILKSGSRFGLRSRQMGITALSLGLAWAGLWRFIN